MQVYKSGMNVRMMNIYKSVFFICFSAISSFLLQSYSAGAVTTTTIHAGAWGTASNWSNGVPSSTDEAVINHVMDFTNVNMNINAGGIYTFNAGANGSSIPLALSMNSGSPGPVLNIYTNVSFAGGINLNAGTINVYNGALLTVTNQVNQAGTQINIEAGGYFSVTGNYLNNGGNIAVDGLLAITGNYNGQNAAAIVTGSGDITTTGSMKGINQSSIFGIINPDCGGPNCSGRNLCGRIASCLPASAVYCSTPVVLTGAVNNGTPTAYQWQTSSTNTEAGFANISGATNSTLSVSPSSTTYYRIKITVGGCTSLSPVSVVTISTCSKTWTGALSTSWHTDGNWSPSGRPTPRQDVVIPNVINKPVVSDTASARDIVVQSGSAVSITASGNLKVYGNFSNNGTLTTITGSTITFKGSAAQAVSGIPEVHDLSLDKEAGTVSLFSATSVKDAVNLYGGTLATNGYLTIDFNAGGNIAYHAEDAGNITGNVTGLRSIVGAKSHYISAPFAGVTTLQVAQTTPLYVSPYWKMYARNFTTQNWVAVTNTITAMPLGTGFSLSLPSPAPLSFTGTYNHTYTLTGQQYENYVSGKYIFIGNPYPSVIDWDNASGFTKTNVLGAIYYWNASNSVYASYASNIGTNGGTRYIAPMQAFLVSTTGAGGFSSISINNNARVTLQNPSFLRESPEDIIRITLQPENSDQKDETVIRFNEDASVDFDSDLDAYKLLNSGTTPSVYTALNNQTYSINSLESSSSVPSIPVCAKLPADGNYTLTFDIKNPALECILLDKKLGTENLISGPSYMFSGLKADDVNRFELQFRTAVTTAVVTAGATEGVKILSSTRGFVVQTNNNSSVTDIEILDVTGKTVLILADKNLSDSSTFIPLDLSEGAYLVKVMIDGKTYAQLISLLK
ncbi:MAG: T9SS type A sorting domain-containing protein [Cytophaga sp.]|uniref:T9SS type A sorting domain-containing protein n=1 Tax=Cytophaga sp. TaxID=29535 RepID=UPI003F7DB021